MNSACAPRHPAESTKERRTSPIRVTDGLFTSEAVSAGHSDKTLSDWLTSWTELHLNPAGSFHIRGPVADAGLTGREITADNYGGMARHGLGAFSGKDATKVDRSADHAGRQLARDAVARGWARACEVRLAYAIGRARPVAVDFDVLGPG